MWFKNKNTTSVVETFRRNVFTICAFYQRRRSAGTSLQYVRFIKDNVIAFNFKINVGIIGYF
jgi:hypothetical protein